MSKPTLIQTLLNRPSQTYYNPPAEHPQHCYHSAKQDMLRIAQAAAASDQGHISSQFDSFSNSEYFTADSSPRSSVVVMSANPSKNSASRKPKRRSLTELNTSYGGAVPSTRTPSSAGPNGQRAIYSLSTHSSLSSTSLDGHSIFSDYLTAGAGDSLEDVRVIASSGAASPASAAREPGAGASNLIRSTSTSTRTSTRTARTTTTTTVTSATATPTVKSTTTPISRPAKPIATRTGAAHAARTKPAATPKPRTPSGPSERPRIPAKTSGPATALPQALPTPNGRATSNAHLNSTPKPTATTDSAKVWLPVRHPSTHPTSSKSPPSNTPPTTAPKPKAFNAFAPIPVATRQAPLPPEPTSKSKSGSPHPAAPQPAAPTAGKPAGIITSLTKSRQDADPSTTINVKPPHSLYKPNGTGQGIQTLSRPISNNNNNSNNGFASTSHSSMPPRRQAQHHPPPLPMPSKMPNSMMLMMNSMSAVMEEDEDYIDLLEGEEDDGKGEQKKTLRHTMERGRKRRKSHGPVEGLGAFIGSKGKEKESELGDDDDDDEGLEDNGFRINPYPRSYSNSSTSTTSGSEGQTTPVTRFPPPLHRRRSRSLDSGSSRPRFSQGQEGPGPKLQTLSTEVQALTLASGDLPSIGTRGYSGLVLPRAPASSLPLSSASASEQRGRGSGFLGNLPTALGLNLKSKPAGGDGKVDLTRSGVARTTMASVEVVRGLAESSSSSSAAAAVYGFGSRNAKLGRSGSWKVKDVFVGALGRRGSERPELRGGESTVLGFTSYRSPPTNVPSRSVLVQVWAVGVDGVDGRLVGVRFENAAAAVGGGGVDRQERGGRNGVEEKNEVADEEEGGGERIGGSETEVEREEIGDMQQDEDVTATQSTPFRSKNPFASLGRSLSLSLNLRKQRRNGSGDGHPDEQPPSKRGQSFSFRNRKEEAGTHMGKKRVGQTALGQQQEHHRESNGMAISSPSKPLKLKARTKGATVKEREREGQHHSSVSAAKSSPKSTSVPPPPAVAAAAGKQSQAQDRHVVDSMQSPRSKRKPVPVTPSPITPTPQNDKPKRTKSKSRPKPKVAEVGYIPGRSFVGRVVEVGWELGEEVVRRGEWVVGLTDVRKCGSLAEFIVVDRHRVHRVPHPRKAVLKDNPDAPASPIWVGEEMFPIEEEAAGLRSGRGVRPEKNKPMPPMPAGSMLTLEELALLPLCGIPAYRAVRTFMYAFSNDPVAPSPSSPPSLAEGGGGGGGGEDPYSARRRALVLRGHDGAGAMAAQILIQRGWRVSVHVPFTCVPAHATQKAADEFMRAVEHRAREWGADEVIFDDGEATATTAAEGGVTEGSAGGNGATVGDGDDGRAAAVRVMETLREDGDVFDAVLDTIGGKEVREAGERLLRSGGLLPFPHPPPPPGASAGTPLGVKLKRSGIGHFTTLVGDTPERPIPSASDAFRANLRSFRLGLGGGDSGEASSGGNNSHSKSKSKFAPISTDGLDNNNNPVISNQGKVGYAWVSVAQEVSEWEGEDIGETIGAVLRLAIEEGIRPLVEDAGGGILGRPRVVPFEQTPSVFVDNGALADGGTVVVRVAG